MVGSKWLRIAWMAFGWQAGWALGAELPELALPSSLGSAQASAAKFYAGVTSDGGASYGTEFDPNSPLTLQAEIRVAPEHVAMTGNVYVLLVAGQQFYMQQPDGAFVPWDGTLEGLVPVVAGKPLTTTVSFDVVTGVAFGPLGLSGLAFQLYLGYDTGDVAGMNYSGEPARFSISQGQSANPEQVAFDYFSAQIATPIIQGNCMVCHVAGGVASASALVYVPADAPNSLQQNFELLRSYALNTPNGAAQMLSKPQGQLHGGGVRLPPGSPQLSDWSEFVGLLNASADTGSSESALLKVTLLDNAATLRKATLLFAGRLPTTEELQRVANGSAAVLAETIRGAMQGPGFKQFLTEGANDRLLSFGVTAPAQALDRYRYPALDELLESGSRTDLALTQQALQREPLELIAHVVMNERPYTEILTADYLMVNPYSARIYGGNVVFEDSTDPDEWREGRITNYLRCTVCAGPNDNSRYDIPTEYPHAGLLNSPMFLARFPSTETNRNRARARWAYYFFLGVDIEGLSVRTTDPAALADTNNPTLNNPNCTVCHTIMDPVAGAFQNFGDEGRYKGAPGGEDALPRSYKRDRNGLYSPGDRWFADMLAPGFNGRLAPNPDESLQWLAAEFAADPRFGFGTVNFWYPAVMGRDLFAMPENPEDADFLARQLAYASEQDMVMQVAAAFLDGGAGQGAFNLKDLLTALALSPYFRAAEASSLSDTEASELMGVGIGRLLTPEQLDRKLQSTTGYTWRYGRTNALMDVYRLTYGGIDSAGVTERVTELNTLMSTVVTTLANEASCPMVAQDFGRPASERFLFPEVELTSLPTTHADAIKRNLQYLHGRLLGEDLTITDPELEASFGLFEAVWSSRTTAGKGPVVSSSNELCLFEGTEGAVRTDPNQTLRAWAAVLNYLLRDFRFIHE